MNRITLILLILPLFFNCKSTINSKNPDFTLKNDSINLYAFIGKKISVNEFPVESKVESIIDSITGDTIRYLRSIAMDRGFNAKYKVLKNIFNELPSETIDFTVFDHYGRPAFEKHRYVILYISLSKKENVYYHQKYLFDPLRKVKDGYWQGVNGETIEELFIKMKKEELKSRGLFD
jgi:hypothetical protein